MKTRRNKARWARLTQRKTSESSKLTYKSRWQELGKRKPVTERVGTRKEYPAKSQLSSERCLIWKAPGKEDGEQTMGNEWGVEGKTWLGVKSARAPWESLPENPLESWSWQVLWTAQEQREVSASPDLRLRQPRSAPSQVTSQRLLPDFQRGNTSLCFHRGVFQLPFQSPCHLVTLELTWALTEMLKNNLVRKSLQEDKEERERAVSTGSCLHQAVHCWKREMAWRVAEQKDLGHGCICVGVFAHSNNVCKTGRRAGT